MVSATRMQSAKATRNRAKGALYADSPEHCSVSVRKIKNGFLVSKSVSSGDKYDHEEVYHEKKPTVDIQSIPHLGAETKSTKMNSDALRKASGNKKVKST